MVSTQLGLRHLAGTCPVHVDIDGRAHAEVSRQKGSGTLDDPPVIYEVETLQPTFRRSRDPFGRILRNSQLLGRDRRGDTAMASSSMAGKGCEGL